MSRAECPKLGTGVLFLSGRCFTNVQSQLQPGVSPSRLSFIPLLLILFIAPQWDWSSLLVLVMVFCILSFASSLKRYCHGKPLELILYIGRNTLPIYMFHPMFTIAGKFLLPFFRFDSSGIVHAIVVVLIGLAGSVLLAKTMDRLHLSWIFGRPQLLR